MSYKGTVEIFLKWGSVESLSIVSIFIAVESSLTCVEHLTVGFKGQLSFNGQFKKKFVILNHFPYCHYPTIIFTIPLLQLSPTTFDCVTFLVCYIFYDMQPYIKIIIHTWLSQLFAYTVCCQIITQPSINAINNQFENNS